VYKSPKELNEMNFKIKRVLTLSIGILFNCHFLIAQDYSGPLGVEAALEPPTINTSPLPEYDYDRLDYAMTIGIERTSKGRIWACWVGGGDNDDAFFVLSTSDDKGESWSKPRVVIDPHDSRLLSKRNVIVGNLWLDPTGRLWLFFSQSMSFYDGRMGNWYTICENPDDDNPVWSEPVRMWHGCSLNKPTILSDGTWLLGVSLWVRHRITDDYKEMFHELDSLRGANIFLSRDKGNTWERKGHVLFPKWNYDELHVVELNNGTLWMTARTGDGIWQSFSKDKGQSWSEPSKYMEHTSSRHFLRRLQSGRLLLVKHGDIDQKTRGRSQLKAFISDDDGKTWKGGLMLDERRGISYPDGFQAPDGTIYISYDRNRDNDGHILMARFTEKDVLNGAFKSRNSKAKILISQPLGIEIKREY